MVAGYAALVLGASVVPADADVPIAYLDKAAHLCEYFVFAWLLAQAMRVHSGGEGGYLLWAWVYATSYGLLMELIQAMIPWRAADLADAALNAVGAGLGVWVVRRIARRNRPRHRLG